MSLSCGIDFGTTNSAAGLTSTAQKPTLVFLEKSSYTIPSAVFFNNRTHTIHYGQEAADLYLIGEEGRYMRSLKRLLGTELMGYHTQIGKEVLKFDKILASFLGHLKSQIDCCADSPVEQVVMGRPVRFRLDDEKADARAQNELEILAKSIGFKNVEFQFEPIAAAFAHENHLSSEKLAVVVDIGGGTSDFTIIRLGPALKDKTDRSNDILASTGIMIGGNDFDLNLSIASFMPLVGRGTTYGAKHLTVPSSIFFDLSEWSKINSAYTQKNIAEALEIYALSDTPNIYGRLVEVLQNNLGHKLLNETENAKINLSHQEKLDVHLDFLSDKPSAFMMKETFEKSIMRPLNQINKALNECLVQANISPCQINLIILTGGSTEIPIIQHQMKTLFQNATLAAGDKLSSVGLGLAYDARRRFR